MNESREEFISRIIWMVQKIESSNFKSLDILSMIDFQLKQREVDLIKKYRDLSVSIIESSSLGEHINNKHITRKVSTKVEVEFNKLINKKR